MGTNGVRRSCSQLRPDPSHNRHRGQRMPFLSFTAPGTNGTLIKLMGVRGQPYIWSHVSEVSGTGGWAGARRHGLQHSHVSM